MSTDIILRRSQDTGIIQRAILRGFNLAAAADIAAGARKSVPLMHPHATALDSKPMRVDVASVTVNGNGEGDSFALVADATGEPFAVILPTACAICGGDGALDDEGTPCPNPIHA